MCWIMAKGESTNSDFIIIDSGTRSGCTEIVHIDFFKIMFVNQHRDIQTYGDQFLPL